MKGSEIKDGAMIVLAVGCLTFAALYFAARDDVERLENQGREMFMMLPDHQQQLLVEDWDARQEALGAEPQYNR